MKNMGQAMMGNAEHSGENRAKVAAELALNNPLLDNSSIEGASSILLNIKGGLDMALFEVDEAASLIRQKVDENANIIFGSSIDEELDGTIKVSIVATGIDNEDINNSKSAISLVEKEGNNTDNQNIKAETEGSDLSSSKQIDIETQIANLDSINEFDIHKNERTKDLNKSNEPINFLDDKEKELSEIINNKKNELPSKIEENQFLKKISNLFLSSKRNIDSDLIQKKEDMHILKNNELKDEKTHDVETPKININNEIPKKVEIEKQISLLEIADKDEKEISDDILEIPAFLRRQAN